MPFMKSQDFYILANMILYKRVKNAFKKQRRGHCVLEDLMHDCYLQSKV